MSERTKQIVIIVVISTLSVMVLATTSVGIWLGASNNMQHPDPDWQLQISGNIVGDSQTLNMSEILDMPSYKDKYVIRSGNTIVARFQGVKLSYLFNEVIDVQQSAVNVTFVAFDGFNKTLNLTDIFDDDRNILAYKMNRYFMDNYQNEGDGYLRLIIAAEDENDYNGQFCIRNVVEIIFA
jgi:DMSO/TMAO reductase YedYZ molybdopterin-dependent catalytic subunit